MKNSGIKIVSSFLIMFLFFPVNTESNKNKKIRWNDEIHVNWSNVNLDDATFWQSLSFPEHFQWGCATSGMQIEGVQTYNNQFVKNNWTEDPKMEGEFVENNGADHWNRYKEDVQLIKKAGITSYRFSIPWEKIEPIKGIYDQKAMQHYKDLVHELRKNSIEPWVCLFHFTIPVWFKDLGGFEKKENMIHFINFCNYVFDNLNDQVRFWATYNEPSAYVLEAYFLGKYPPHKSSFTTITPGLVMKNMLNAHIKIYKSFKKKNSNAQIGLIKMFHPIDRYSKWNPLEKVISEGGNHLLHDTVLDYFKTGCFNWFYLVMDKNRQAQKALDYIGVNYYSHELIQCGPLNWGLKKSKREIKVPDKDQGIYAEGLYRAIVKASELNVPIYISENGIADHTDLVRNEFIKQHLYATQCALDDGYDIRGYFYWTLMDSLGWKKNYTSKYGLYAVDEKTKNRTLRNGAKPFVKFLNNQPKKWNLQCTIQKRA